MDVDEIVGYQPTRSVDETEQNEPKYGQSKDKYINDILQQSNSSKKQYNFLDDNWVNKVGFIISPVNHTGVTLWYALKKSNFIFHSKIVQKKMIIQFDRKLIKNQEKRIKYANEPTSFLSRFTFFLIENWKIDEQLTI